MVLGLLLLLQLGNGWAPTEEEAATWQEQKQRRLRALDQQQPVDGGGRWLDPALPPTDGTRPFGD